MDPAASVARALPGLPTSTTLADRVTYARDLWPRHHLDVRAGRPATHAPAGVVWPRTVEEAAAVVRFAVAEGVPLVPFGAGSGVCGGILPDARALVVDLKRLGGFRVDAEAPALDVGPGVMGITLEEELGERGFTVGHFPSSIVCSTVGGWVAARGAGQCSGRYGKIEDMVLGLTVVGAAGEPIELRRRTTGPDAIPLWIGSEGTLGLIVGTRLRLHPAPTERQYLAFSFPDIEAGWAAMQRLYQAGLRPPVCRLYDAIDSAMMRRGAVRGRSDAGHDDPGAGPARDPTSAASGARRGAAAAGRSPYARARARALGAAARAALGQPALLNRLIAATEGNLLGGCTLVLVFEGTAPDEVRHDAAQAVTLCGAAGGTPLGEGPARRWWAHRYAVSFRQAPVFRLGAFSDTFEVAAPWSALGAVFHGVRRALGRHVLVMAHLSHAYPDGCSIYFTFSGACRSDAEALVTYDRAWADAMAAVVAAGGTPSHHHGSGRSKAAGLAAELGPAVGMLRRVLGAADPAGVFNPGNLVPPGTAALPGRALPPAGLDRSSLLYTARGEDTLGATQDALHRQGLELRAGETPGATTIAAWVAAGLPGAPNPWHDPVDHTLVGLAATLTNAERIVLPPVPRRATGPDLAALFAGAGGLAGAVTGAVLRVHPRLGDRARVLPLAVDPSPAPGAAERAMLEGWARAAGGA